MYVLNILGSISAIDIIELVLVCVSVFAAVYFNNQRMRVENEKRLDEKADIDYVDKQDRAVHHRINSIEKSHENDFKEILEQLREIRLYIMGKK